MEETVLRKIKTLRGNVVRLIKPATGSPYFKFAGSVAGKDYFDYTITQGKKTSTSRVVVTVRTPKEAVIQANNVFAQGMIGATFEILPLANDKLDKNRAVYFAMGGVPKPRVEHRKDGIYYIYQTEEYELVVIYPHNRLPPRILFTGRTSKSYHFKYKVGQDKQVSVAAINIQILGKAAFKKF